MPSASSARPDPDLYRRLVEDLDDCAIFLVDAEGKIVTWNRGAERITGYNQGEMVGEPITRLLPSAEAHPQASGSPMGQPRDESRRLEEGWRMRKNGARFWAQSVVTPIAADNGRLLGYSYILRDLTDRKRTDEELARSTGELEQFASVVSHDLRSPLLAISGCAQLLREQFVEALGSESDELLGMIQDGVNRMGLIIKDLLAFARATPARARTEAVNAEDVFTEALTGLHASILQASATVTHDPLPTVKGNAAQLGQVFSHLVGNALKYHQEEPPRIHVSARESGDAWEFSVRDNGIGIDPAYFEKIFAVFQRLHEESKYGGGSGIGLAICKKIVEHHGGHIRVESQPGQGSTFFFTLPKP